ncbi:receptor-like protein 12 [Gossypium australe]|uniref:Receptor-like protein 12 n=1 Tax=Gossypium australe TaxID=47621 RepID=A0A5B6VDD9_9ROSI|nr:receptor-like protein 12 [Gossypium australe]
MTFTLEINKNLPTKYHYGTRGKIRAINQRSERLKQIQKDMQDQLKAQLVLVTIRPQQYQAGTSAPVNYPTGSGSNPRDNPTNPVVPDLADMAEMDKVKVELPKQLEDQCKWLEEKFRDVESAKYLCGVDAKELSLVPDLVLPPKFKTPEFEKYNGISCLEAHITIFYQRMTGYVNNDQLLIHYF